MYNMHSSIETFASSSPVISRYTRFQLHSEACFLFMMVPPTESMAEASKVSQKTEFLNATEIHCYYGFHMNTSI